MTVIYQPSLQIGGAWVALSPLLLRIAGPLELAKNETDFIPLHDAADPGFIETDGGLYGYEWNFMGVYALNSPGAGKLYQAEMRSWFRNGDGSKREIVFAGYTDSDGAIKDVWKGCTLSSPLTFDEAKYRRAGLAEYSFSLRTPYITPAATAPDSSIPDITANPYKAWLYQSNYTAPAAGGGGGAPEVVVQVVGPYKISASFRGALDAATAAGNADTRQRKIILSSARGYKVKSIQVIGAQIDAGQVAGTTIVRASDADYAGAPGNYIQVELAYNAATAGPATGAVTIAAGDPVYVYIPSAPAGHSDVEVLVEVEPA